MFPDKTVKLLVGFPAGGPSDHLARIVAQKLTDHWKQPVIVENRVGASGVIAGTAVARAAPDGYTLAFAGSTTFVGFELLNPGKVPYRSLEAFEPVAHVADQTMVMSIRGSLGAISFLRSRSEVDRERIGLWGTSYSGGHALVVGAMDRRLKAVVTQAFTVDGH